MTFDLYIWQADWFRLSVSCDSRSHMSEFTVIGGSELREFSVHCNRLCTFSLVNDIMFFYDGPYGSKTLPQQPPCNEHCAQTVCCMVLVASYPRRHRRAKTRLILIASGAGQSLQCIIGIYCFVTEWLCVDVVTAGSYTQDVPVKPNSRSLPALGSRVTTGPGKSWKVMEFRKTIFQAWKVMENNKGHEKS